MILNVSRALGVTLAAFALAGCSTYVEPPGTMDKTTFSTIEPPKKPEPGSTVLAHSAQVFAFALLDSAGDPNDTGKALKAFRTGKALIDLHCGAYLDALGMANQRASNQRKQIDIVGGALAAVGGLTGAQAKEIAISSSLFSFGGTSMDASTAAFIFSDAAKSVPKLVREAQKTYVTALDGKLAALDYSAAVDLLTGYESLCRPGEIRRLVDEAIGSAKMVAESPGALPVSTATVILVNKLMGEFSRSLSEVDAITLYAWFTNPARRADIQAQSPLIQQLVSPPSSADALAAKLAPYFVPLGVKGDPIAERWEPAVATVPGVQPSAAAGGQSDPAAAAVGAAGAGTAGASEAAAALRRAIVITAPTVSVGR